jgi:hypothetical protein
MIGVKEGRVSRGKEKKKTFSGKMDEIFLYLARVTRLAEFLPVDQLLTFESFFNY